MAKKAESFESALAQLQDILEKLSSEDITLDASIAEYAKAAQLIHFCRGQLAKAEIRIREIEDTLEEAEGKDGF